MGAGAGYANKPAKAEALAQAGLQAVVTDLAEITAALRITPGHTGQRVDAPMSSRRRQRCGGRR